MTENEDTKHLTTIHRIHSTNTAKQKHFLNSSKSPILEYSENILALLAKD